MSTHTINTIEAIFKLTFLFVFALVVFYAVNVANTFGYSVQSVNQLIGLANHLIGIASSLIGL